MRHLRAIWLSPLATLIRARASHLTPRGQPRSLDTGRRRMKAIVVRDEAAGTAGMTLVERPEPPQR